MGGDVCKSAGGMTGSMVLRVREGEGAEGPRGARARLVAPFQYLVLSMGLKLIGRLSDKTTHRITPLELSISLLILATSDRQQYPPPPFPTILCPRTTYPF